MLVINRPALGYVSAPLLAAELGADFVTLRQGDIAPPAAAYLRWGCIHSLANKNAKVINSSKAIHQVSNKSEFRKQLGDLSPKTWSNPEEVPEDVLYGNGVIVRPARHAGGNKLYHCKTLAGAITAAMYCGVGYYITEYIPKIKEFRVHCVQGRVVGVSEKNPPNREAVSWNFHGDDGDTEFNNIKWSEWPMDVVNLALAALSKSRLHFGAVDVIHDGKRPYVLEINSAPSLSPYRASCYGRALSYSIERDQLKRDEYEHAHKNLDNWKQAIHPGLYQ